MFKGRNIKDTSNRNMLRMDKRERIIASVLSYGIINKDSAILLHFYNKETQDWVSNLVAETKWLDIDNALFGTIEYKPNSRSRIYRKWVYHKDLKSYAQVLKYLYSPLYPTLLLIKGMFINDETGITISLPSTADNSGSLLVPWFKKEFDIECIHDDINFINSLHFKDKQAMKLLSLVDPLLKQMPEAYKQIYREVVQPWQI